MPERTLYYDCFSGISGDMNLGALLDLGVPEAHLRAELSRLGLDDEFTLTIERATRKGIAGTCATVRLVEPARAVPESGATDHAHEHRHEYPHEHPHVHEQGHAHVTLGASGPVAERVAAHAPARNLERITAIIRAAGYAAAVERRAIATFTALAEAEAKVHGTTVDAIHFHEVGAVDAIVDIVGGAIALEWLGVDRVLCGTVEVGGGMVRCAHGLMPVPAPATAELLTGVPCHYQRVEHETTTPTGAALLRASVDRFGPPDGFTAERIGFGIGQKDFPIPNVLRVMLGNQARSHDAAQVANVELEANVDDMSPEACGPLLDALFAHGALDAFLTPIVMKKSRPAIRVSVLADPDDAARLADVLLTHSTTLGVRSHTVTKRMLPRESVTLATRHGPVRVKLAHRPDGRTTWKVEHDDIETMAVRTAAAYLVVRREVESDVAAMLDAGAIGANDAAAVPEVRDDG